MAQFDGFPHVIESQQFPVASLEDVFESAKEMQFVVQYCKNNSKQCDLLKGKKMINLFYEPSTRTRISFEIAMSYLGGHVFSTENAREFSSAIKGETIEDTIRVLCGYKADVIVLRHYEEGSAARAAKVSSVPIINAGDGKGQHPTQSLLDLYTIHKKFGRIDDLTIAMVGDLANGRTVRSLSYLLGKFEGIKIYFVSPECAKMKSDIKDYLQKHNTKFYEVNDLRSVAYEVDVIYQTRTQKERGSDFEKNNADGGFFMVNGEVLYSMKKHAIIMHPLPKNDEISPEVDQDHRAVYYEQAENGLYVRMALLRMILSPGNVFMTYR